MLTGVCILEMGVGGNTFDELEGHGAARSKTQDCGNEPSPRVECAACASMPRSLRSRLDKHAHRSCQFIEALCCNCCSNKFVILFDLIENFRVIEIKF